MGLDIKDVFYGGQWFRIQGKQKAIENLQQQTITDLCKKTIEEQLPTDSNFTVRKLGTRQAVRQTSPQEAAKASSLLQPLIALRNAFSRFVEFVTHRTLKEKERERAELRFIMQLFGSEDEGLLDRLFPTDSQEASRETLSSLTFSSVLKIWIDTMEARPDPDSTLTETIKRLRKLESYQRSIETLRHIPSPQKRADARKKLNGEIVAELEELKTDEKLYIPGGVWNPETRESLPMIYEITKKSVKTGGYILRAIDISGKLLQRSPVSEAAPAPSPQPKEEREEVREGIEALEGKKKEEARESYLESTREISNEDLAQQIDRYTSALSGFESTQSQGKKPSTLKIFLQILKGTSPGADDEPTEAERKQSVPQANITRGNVAKPRKASAFQEAQLGRAFLRVVEPNVYKAQKQILRARYFLSLWEKSADHIEDKDFRSFMATQIDKILRGLPQEAKPLKDDLGDILGEIEKIDKQQRFPVGTEGTSSVSTQFSAPLQPEQPMIAPSSFRTQTITPLVPPQTSDISAIMTSGTPAQLKEHVAMLEGLAKKRQYAVLHYQLRKDFLALKSLKLDGIDRLLARGKAEEWMEQIKALGFLLQRCSYGLGRIAPSPEDISFILRSLMLQDQIARCAESLKDDPYVKDFVFDIHPIEKILQNSYLSLGESAADINDILSYFKELSDKTLVRGMWCGSGGCQTSDDTVTALQSRDRALFLGYAKSSDRELVNLVAQDVDGSANLVPPHLVHLRQSYLLLQTFVAPTRTFVPYTWRGFLTMLNVIREDVSGASMDDLYAAGQKIAYKKMAQKIPDFLRAHDGPICFTIKKSGPMDCDVIAVEPWDLSIFDLDDSLQDYLLGSRFDFEHMGSFDRNGVPIEDSLLRERCFEQVVAECPERDATSKGVNDSGQPDRPWSSPFREHRMKGRTEWQILQGRDRILGLDLPTSRQMQLMETGPHTIIPNTLAFLKANQALLGDKEYGPAILRLIERNLFRNATFNTAPQDVQDRARQQIEVMLREAKDTKDISSYLRLLSLLRVMYAGKVLPQNIQQDITDSRFEALAIEHSCSRMFYQEMLLIDAMSPRLDLEQKITRLFKLKSTPSRYRERDPLKEQRIQELSLDILSEVQPKAGQKAFIQKILQSLGKTVPEADLAPVGSSGLVFVYGPYQIDFSRFEIWENNQRREVLPPSVTEVSSFSALESILGSTARTGEWTASPVVLPAKAKETQPLEGIQYSRQVPDKGLEFRLILTTDGVLRIYRRKIGKGNKWFQYEPSLFAASPAVKAKPLDVVPRVLSQGACWVREDGKELSVEQGGQVLYTAQLSGLPSLQVRSLQKVGNGGTQPTTAVNVLGGREFEHFCDIEQQGYVIAYATSGKQPTRIEYIRSGTPYAYVWDATNCRWCSEQSSGYFLSDKSLELYASPSIPSESDSGNPAVEQGLSKLQGLFHPGFHSYHLLEHESKPAQLIMPRVRLQPPPPRRDLPQRFVPQFTGGTIPQYVFEIDPIKGLVPKKQPEGYLYLAYSLMAQGNYKDAFFYLDKANLQRTLGAEGQEILGWIKSHLDQLPQDRPELILLRARLFLMEPVLTGKHVESNSVAGQKKSFEAYRFLTLVDRNKSSFPEGMALTELELRRLQQLKESSMISFLYALTETPDKWDMAHNVSELLQGIFEEKADDLDAWAASLQERNREEKCKERFPIIWLYKTGKISEGEFASLVQSMPHLALQKEMYNSICVAWPLSCEVNGQLQRLNHDIQDSLEHQGFLSQVEKLQTLQQLKIWKDFNDQILKPFNISLRELLFLQKEGQLERVFAARSSEEQGTADSFLKQSLKLSEIREKFALRAAIERLQKEIAGVVERPRPELGEPSPTRLFSQDELGGWERYFEAVQQDEGGGTKLSPEIVGPVLTIPKEGEVSYAQQIDRGLRDDAKVHIQQAPDLPQVIQKAAGRQTTGTARTDQKVCAGKREPLRSFLQKLRDTKRAAAEEQRRACLKILQKGGPRVLLLQERVRRVGRSFSETLFDTAVRCYGENGNFDRLKSLGVEITAEDEIGLKDALGKYLQLSIQARQLQRCLEIEAELPPDASHEDYLRGSREIQAILNGEWQYNVKTDPLAPTLLLIEYDLGFVCRKSQIEVVRENLCIENRFKQEMCGGGKTTVLRNIISQFRADGRTLSGVSTLEPLRAEHGLMYARTTRNAFGEMVFDFHFDRGVPTDERSLLYLHHTLLQTTVEKGRLDLSKGDLQSFKLAKNLKHEEIRKKRLQQKNMAEDSEEWKALEGEIEQLHAEIDIMEDIWDFMVSHVAIMADELDKDCDPTQEKNYAYGASREIDPQKRNAILTIFSKLLIGSEGNVQELGTAIRGNKQAKMDPQKRKQALLELAKALYAEYKRKGGSLVPLSEDDFIAYILPPAVSGKKAEDANKGYHTLFDAYKDKEAVPEVLQQIAWARKFLWENFTPEGALSKTGGVNYGRAHDDVSVIPYAGSDKPKERSQHGNDLERLVYTCLDYVQRGLSLGQVRAAYIKAKEDALKAVLTASRKGETLSLDDTEAARIFKSQFLDFLEEPRPTLSTVTDEQLESVRTQVTKKPELLLRFLGDTVLSDLRQSEEKIVSDAQDPPNMVKSYSGSSGTDTGCYALPDKIRREGARQLGVHGEVIRWLLESEAAQGLSTFIELPEEWTPDSLYETLANQMHGGDCISDVGRFFPGVSPRTIAENLLRQQKDVKYVVFMTPDDRWVMLMREGEGFKEVKYEPSDDPRVLKERITIFDDVHTRGAERSSTAGVTEFVTLDVDTDWSRFEQGVMRERNLTKGKAKVRYILSPELKQRLIGGGKLSVNALLTVLAENEARQLKVLNYKAERQKIKHILKRTGEQALRDVSRAGREGGFHQHNRVREAMYDVLRTDLYVVSTTVGVLEAACPQGEQTATEALDALVESQRMRLQNAVRTVEENKDIAQARIPTTVASMRDHLGQLDKDIGRILAAQSELATKREAVRTAHRASRISKVLGGQEQIDEAMASFKESQTKTEMLQAKQKEIREMLAKLDDISKTAQELRIDALAPFQEVCRTMSVDITDVRKQIQANQRAVEKATPTGIASWLAGGVSRALQDVRSSLQGLDEALEGTQKTLTTIETSGTPLVTIACQTLKDGDLYLQAKLSDTRREKSPAVDQLVRYGYGRVEPLVLPDTVSQGTSESGNEQEVEQEQEQEQEVEEAEVGAESVADEGAFPHQEIQATVPQLLQGDLPPDIHRLTDYTGLLPLGKVFTENCFPVTASKGKIRPWEKVEGVRVTIPAAQQCIDRTLLVVDTQTGQVVELYGSRLDGERLFPTLHSNERHAVFTYNYALGDFEGEKPQPTHVVAVMQHIATTKVLRGDVEFFEDKEHPLLNTYGALVQYLKTLDSAKRSSLKETVQRILVARQQHSFAGSDLERAFAEAERASPKT